MDAAYKVGSTSAYDDGNAKAAVTPTVGHTWVIIVGALAILWVLGGFVFRSVRM
jgi:amino acid transporter